MFKKILVAFDGSEQSLKAFDFALQLASSCVGTSHEITVISVAQPPEPADIVEVNAVIDNAISYYEKLFGDLKNKAKSRNLEIRTEVLIGHPADQIIRYASETNADIIILGQTGKSKIQNWLLGSVSKRVCTYAPCTVTIVK